jgi:SAM-dependent methyltransferase
MPALDPARTYAIFRHDHVAAGYATARPFLHPQVFARVRDLLHPEAPLRRALDVGCGTGMSSVALRCLAREVVGLDVSLEMLRQARRESGVRYLAATAEALPFQDASFDLIAACGAMSWVDRSAFLPRARDLLVRNGWLVSLDFGNSGRAADLPALERWHEEVFDRVFPRLTARDPILREEEARRHSFSEPRTESIGLEWRFAEREYAACLMTESRVVAAVEHGSRTADEIRRWLDAELTSLFEGRTHVVAFDGYIQVLRKL